MNKSIAIVGAGVAGAVCARKLAGQGFSVHVFDKGRGPGGRTSSRRTETGHRFDHGAARMDVTRPELHNLLSPAVASGVLRRAGDSYLSATGLGALCKWLLEGLPATYSTKIVGVEHDVHWHARDEASRSYGPFDAVVLSVPPVNATEIVRELEPELAAQISSVTMLPRWVAMLAFAERQTQVPDHSTVGEHVLRRSLSNSVGDALVVEAGESWSIEHVELDTADVGRRLLETVKAVLAGATPISITAHRWRYAFAKEPLGQDFLSGENGLYVCGDWCVGRSVEAAWQSGSAVAEAIFSGEPGRLRPVATGPKRPG